MSNKLTVLLIAVALIVGFGIGYSVQAPTVDTTATAGSNTVLTGLSVIPAESDDSFSVGSSGSAIKKMLTGTCNLASTGLNSPFNATSTANFTCAVSGVAAGDRVFVTPPYVSATSSPQLGYSGNGIEFHSASSTAANTITVKLYNNSGAATSSFIQATSSWVYWVVGL